MERARLSAVLVACVLALLTRGGHSAACQLVLGPFGQGSSGAAYAFNDAQLAAAGPITAIQAYSGNWMDSIQVFYAGKAAPRRGGGGGSANALLSLRSGEYITSVSVNSGWYVDSLQVVTNLGRTVVLGPRSSSYTSATPTCGSVSGRTPALVSISGVGNSYLEQITLTWGAPSGILSSPPPPPPPPRASPPSPAPASTVIAGPFSAGAAGADPAFTEGAGAGPITSITVRSGGWIDSVQVTYGSVPSAVHGGAGGGSPQVLTLAPNEYITSVTTRVGGYVESIRFYTSKGRIVNLGNQLDTDTWASACPVGQYKLAAIRGTSGGYLTGLTFVWALLPGAAPAPASGWTCRYGRNEVLRANGAQPQCLGMAGGTSCLQGNTCEAILPCAGASALAPISTCSPGVSTSLAARGVSSTGDYQDPTQFCPRAQGALGLPVGPSPVLIQAVVVSLQLCNSGFSASMDEIRTALFTDVNSLSNFWNAVSYGRARFDASTVTLVQVTLPCSAFSATTCAYDSWMAYINTNYAALGIPTWPNFPFHRMLVCPNTFSYSCGAGFSAGNNVYINGDYVHNPLYDLGIMKHEMGHNIGLAHASTWVNGANNEYGDSSSPMGGYDCERCSYNAPALLLLGWATPLITLHGADLIPGVTRTFLLPALVDTPSHAVVIRVDWVRLSPPAGARPVGAFPTVFLSYRVAKGQDIGLPAAFNQAVMVHSVAQSLGNTYAEASLQSGAAWSDTNFNLAVAASAGAIPANGASVRVCRFLVSVSECGGAFSG